MGQRPGPPGAGVLNTKVSRRSGFFKPVGLDPSHSARYGVGPPLCAVASGTALGLHRVLPRATSFYARLQSRSGGGEGEGMCVFSTADGHITQGANAHDRRPSFPSRRRHPGTRGYPSTSPPVLTMAYVCGCPATLASAAISQAMPSKSKGKSGPAAKVIGSVGAEPPVACCPPRPRPPAPLCLDHLPNPPV